MKTKQSVELPSSYYEQVPVMLWWRWVWEVFSVVWVQVKAVTVSAGEAAVAVQRKMTSS